MTYIYYCWYSYNILLMYSSFFIYFVFFSVVRAAKDLREDKRSLNHLEGDNYKL